MFELHLHGEKANGNSNKGMVQEQLERLRAQRVKLYTTQVTNNNQKTFIFTTTSKDIHLSLGALGQTGRYYLAKLLEEEISRNDSSQLLVYEKKRRARSTGNIDRRKTFFDELHISSRTLSRTAPRSPGIWAVLFYPQPTCARKRGVIHWGYKIRVSNGGLPR